MTKATVYYALPNDVRWHKPGADGKTLCGLPLEPRVERRSYSGSNVPKDLCRQCAHTVDQSLLRSLFERLK